MKLMASCGVRSMKCAEEDVKFMPSCGVLKKHFYIGADGMVAPCMGMCDCTFAGNFPNLFETPLKDILRDSIYTELYAATVGDVRNRNPECRECTGGCRNSVLISCDDYYGIDREVCDFFEKGYDERIRKAAEGPFREYLKRNPPKEKTDRMPQEPTGDCP